MGLFTAKKGLIRSVQAVVFGAAVVVAPAAKSETLADALVGAYNHSGLLTQNRALLRAADEDVAIAAAGLKPVVSWVAQIEQTLGRAQNSRFTGATDADGLDLTAQLNVSQLLYDFGSTRFSIEAAKETVLATRQALISIEQQIFQRAVAAFFLVIEANEFVTLRQNNVRLLQQELRAAENRFEVGEVTRTDVALAEAQLAEARSGLATAQGNLLIAQEEYRNAVGRGPGRLVPPPSLPQLSGNVPAAKAVAVRQHPDLRSAQHQVAATELQILRFEAAKKPTLNATAGVSALESFDSSNFGLTGSVGLTASGTIYQGGSRSATVRAAQAQRDAARGNLHVVRHNIEQNVGDSYARLASARASLASTDRQIRAARIAFRGVREEATLGARTTLDVLDAEQALLDAEAARISAQSQLYTAAYNVLASTGELTATALQLPVQQYDPAAYYNLVKDSPTKQSKQGAQLDRVLERLQRK
ncbi:TolC family outer membrane protein [Sulfitobacter sp. S190]|uniref:TolC family outer membrane protein n=1 Tax=Sulfitobacter sp. S190 TaxID=2867022 RepID=UPI0021A8065A|nr:TolC family outer membrane protein [Sulfitobacter sp. S190]UWR23462.1 TolC family outer membrane protein [Sulfitobacter sp. S190]